MKKNSEIQKQNKYQYNRYQLFDDNITKHKQLNQYKIELIAKICQKNDVIQILQEFWNYMGQCSGKPIKKKTYKSEQQYWREPNDTQKLASVSLQKLLFQGTLANFKIINCPYHAVSVKAQIKGIDTFLLRQKFVKSDKSSNWPFKHKFQFDMTQYELRKSFIEITLLDSIESAVGSIKVNLYLISTGPYHQNFIIQLKNGQHSRIYFDFKIAQIIQIQLNSIKAEIYPNTKHPGEKFNYSIKTIVGHNTALNVSTPSYTVKISLDNKENNQSLNNKSSKDITLKNSGKNTVKLIPEDQNLIWVKEDDQPMPSIVMRTLVTDLHHCCFQLLFWKIYDNNESGNDKGQQIPQLFGECYVALHKIFDIEPITIQKSHEIQQKRTFTSQDKLWNHGKQIGKGYFQFEVTNDKYIKQMQVMVRTQEGIVKYSPVFFTNQKNNSSNCQQLIQLQKIIQEIEQNIIQLDKVLSQDINQPNLQTRKLKVNIEKLLERTLSLLEKSVKTNVIIYSYASPEELKRAQQLFLGIGFKILNYSEEEDPRINDFCWEILVALLERGQFRLEHMGFDQKEKDKIKENKIDSKLQNKIQIALTFHQFFSKLLKIAVQSLNLKGLQLERNFAQVFSAYAYFRIPNFRTAILQAITRANDPQLPEWRQIQFSLQDDIDYDELKKQVNTFTVLFDWSNNFHKCIEHLEKYQIDTLEVNEVLMREDWKFRMSKRGMAFFQFIKCWVEYIQSMVIKPKDIQWKYFPGYNKLLKCFLAEMKKRPILQYPDILKTSLFKLLGNQKLLNPIVHILFNKANIHEPLTVIRAIVFMSEIFTVLCQKQKKIPPTFNYFYFYQGIKIILESQFSFAISKTIVMLYNYYKIFNIQFRRNISMLLLGKVFFRLFFHWSYNVRDVFHHLVMRLYHQTLRTNHDDRNASVCEHEVNEQIRARYIKLTEMLQKALNENREQKKDNNLRQLQKNLHKKLKNKLAHKKAAKNSKIKQENVQKQYLSEVVKYKTLRNRRLLSQQIKCLSPLTQTTQIQSEVYQPQIKQMNKKYEKQQQIKVLNKKSSLHFQHKIYDNTKGQKILIKSTFHDQYGQYAQSDFEIAKIESHLLCYIEPAMKNLKKTNEIFATNFRNKNWELPKIKMEISLDSKEIRPEKIDDW